MKRKVIKQKGSYTVTLPMKWVKEHNVQDELFVEEGDGMLLIKTDSSPEKKEVNVKLETKNTRFIQYILNNYYRSGYDKVVLESDVKSNDVYKAMNLLPGFEVTDSSEGIFTIESMSEVSQPRFDVLMRQLFFIAREDMTYIIESAEKMKKIDAEMLQVNSSRSIKNSNFCLRTVAKKTDGVNPFDWTLINLITWIERQMYYMAKSLQGKKPEKMSKPEMEFMLAIRQSLEKLYKGVYNDSFKDLEVIHQNFTKFEKERFKLLKNQNEYKSIMLYYFNVMQRYIMTSTSSGLGAVMNA